MTWWHGGQIDGGDMVLPPSTLDGARSGDLDGWVYVTPVRSLAMMYAATCGGWLYEVEPVGEVEQDPGSLLPDGQSMRCRSARVVRRFRPSRREVEMYSAAVHAANAAIGADS